MGRHKFRYGRRDINPHLTLARVDKDDLNLMADFAKANRKIPDNGWVCDRFTVCESDGPDHLSGDDSKTRKTSRYRKVFDIKLN